MPTPSEHHLPLLSPVLMKLTYACALTCFCAVWSCSSRPAATASGPSCEERRTHLLDALGKLPRETLAMPISVDLPRGTLRGGVGKGAILTISDDVLLLNGAPPVGQDRAAQLLDLNRNLQQAASELVPSATPDEAAATSATPAQAPQAAASPAPARGPVLYVAAAKGLDVRTLQSVLRHVPPQLSLRLLFATPTPSGADEPEDYAFARQVLAERDPKKRKALAEQGYAEYASCPQVTSAVASVKGLDDAARWPRLQQAMLGAVPACACEDLEPDGLRLLLAAEQRAGSVTLGSVPIDFLREQRCSASMPLRSMQQVLDDVDEFDAEFAGDWKDDALHFEDVVTNERLLNVLCVAMPGDTLASLQRENATLYWKVPGAERCQAWRFEPLARGAPMGSWRREEQGLPELAIHYRQGGEDLRLFGPVTDPKSRATDSGPWPCDQDFHLADQAPDSVSLDQGGRWYFERAACEKAPAAQAVFAGCIANLAAGVAPLPPPSAASPAAEPAPAK